MKTYYKVVRKVGNLLTSCIMWDTESSHTYEIGKWTYRAESDCRKGRKLGPLCVFENLDEARDFIHAAHQCYCIYKCRIRRSRAKFVWDNSFRRVDKNRLPFGTVLADAVMLLETANEEHLLSGQRVAGREYRWLET